MLRSIRALIVCLIFAGVYVAVSLGVLAVHDSHASYMTKDPVGLGFPVVRMVVYAEGIACFIGLGVTLLVRRSNVRLGVRALLLICVAASTVSMLTCAPILLSLHSQLASFVAVLGAPLAAIMFGMYFIKAQ